MNQNKIANDPFEVAKFLTISMLQTGVKIEVVIGGLQKAGVDGLIIKEAVEAALKEVAN